MFALAIVPIAACRNCAMKRAQCVAESQIPRAFSTPWREKTTQVMDLFPHNGKHSAGLFTMRHTSLSLDTALPEQTRKRYTFFRRHGKERGLKRLCIAWRLLTLPTLTSFVTSGNLTRISSITISTAHLTNRVSLITHGGHVKLWRIPALKESWSSGFNGATVGLAFNGALLS